jgi:hypothetical protein
LKLMERVCVLVLPAGVTVSNSAALAPSLTFPVVPLLGQRMLMLPPAGTVLLLPVPQEIDDATPGTSSCAWFKVTPLVPTFLSVMETVQLDVLGQIA